MSGKLCTDRPTPARMYDYYLGGCFLYTRNTAR